MTQRQTKSETTFDAEKARELLKAEREKRLAACWTEIEEVLQKNKCALMAKPVFVETPQGYVVQSQVMVIARDN